MRNPSTVTLAIVCCLLPLAAHAATQACAPIPDGLVSWWPAENDATDIVGANDGVIAGTVTFAPGVVGSGFRFTGNGYVQVPDSPSLNLTEGLSVVFWFQRDPGDFGFESLFAKRDTNLPAPANYGANFRGSSVGLGVYYDDPGFDYPANASDDLNHFEIARVTMPPIRRFHLLAATYTQLASSVLVSTYIDGALVKAKEMPGTLAASVTPNPLMLGTTIPGFEPYHGILDEVQVYDRPLSDTTIRTIFRARGAGVCRPPR